MVVGQWEALAQKDPGGVGVAERERERVGVEVTLPFRPVVGVAPPPAPTHPVEVSEKVPVGEWEGDMEGERVGQEVVEGVGEKVLEAVGEGVVPEVGEPLKDPRGRPSRKPPVGVWDTEVV